MYLLLYTEAANLRHMPECLWFIFWTMRNSKVKMGEVRRLCSLITCCIITIYEPVRCCVPKAIDSTSSPVDLRHDTLYACIGLCFQVRVTSMCTDMVCSRWSLWRARQSPSLGLEGDGQCPGLPSPPAQRVSGARPPPPSTPHPDPLAASCRSNGSLLPICRNLMSRAASPFRTWSAPFRITC